MLLSNCLLMNNQVSQKEKYTVIVLSEACLGLLLWINADLYLVLVFVPHSSRRRIYASISTTFGGDYFCPNLWTDKEVQHWTHTEQDSFRPLHIKHILQYLNLRVNRRRMSFPVPKNELKLIVLNSGLNVAFQFRLKADDPDKGDGRTWNHQRINKQWNFNTNQFMRRLTYFHTHFIPINFKFKIIFKRFMMQFWSFSAFLIPEWDIT